MIVVPEPSQWTREEGRPAPGGEPPPPPGAGEDEEPITLGEKREDFETEMDMTPMVDVTFLLLIFFMVTAAFSMQKSLEIPKPKQDEPSTQATPTPPEEDPAFVTVYVDEFNTYRVVTVEWDEEAPSEQELLRKLREARGGHNPPTKLLVKAHTDSLHEKVVSALDAGTEVGMEQVQLMTVEEMD
jgi:biopolymer transport protein ExbD